MSRRALALAVLVVSGVNVAVAQNDPARPLRLICPSQPGSIADFLSRLVAENLAKHLGVSVIVDSRPGARGVNGTEIVASSPPDGHTLLMATSRHAVNSVLAVNLPYDSIRDFAPVAHVGSTPLLLVVHPAVPSRSVQELIALAKAKPAEVQLAAAAAGSVSALAAQLFQSMARIDIVEMRYERSAPALIDVLAGRPNVMFDAIGTSFPLARSGRLSMLAVTSPTRSSMAPEVPTMAESGFAQFDVRSWFVILAPARTPREILERLNLAINASLANADFRSFISAEGLEIAGGTPAEASVFIRSELSRWQKLMNAARKTKG